MIPLRIAQFIGPLKVSAASSAAINLSRWLVFRTSQFTAARVVTASKSAAMPIWMFCITSRQDQAGCLAVVDRCWTALLEWSPDVIHVHRPECVPLALRAAQDGVPVVLSVHGLPDERTAEAIRHQSIHAITVPNEYMRARLATDFACPVDRISVLPYGFQPERFELPAANSPPVVIGCFADEDVAYSVSMLRAALELEPILSDAKVVMVVSHENLG